MNSTYTCPECDEWIEILASSNPKNFRCPWCGEALRLEADGEFLNGAWRDRSKLVTAGSHWDE
jgi:transcription initiation factor IIE alpha subunit